MVNIASDYHSALIDSNISNASANLVTVLKTLLIILLHILGVSPKVYAGRKRQLQTAYNVSS